jgi:hypothetical protein
MEGSKASREEAPLPDEAEVLELPETHQNRLSTVASLLRERFENSSGNAPESPPPLTIEQLAFAQAEAAAEEDNGEAVEVDIEEVEEADSERQQARRRLEEVYDAAEKDLPIEAQNERRVEVKGDPAADANSTFNAAATMHKILTDIKARTAAAHAAFSKFAPQAKQAIPAVRLPRAFTNLPAMYRQAMGLGFGLAILVLTGILLLN